MNIINAVKPDKGAYWKYDTMDLVMGIYDEPCATVSDDRLMDMIKMYFFYYSEYMSILARVAEEKYGLTEYDAWEFNKKFLEGKWWR